MIIWGTICTVSTTKDRLKKQKNDIPFAGPLRIAPFVALLCCSPLPGASRLRGRPPGGYGVSSRAPTADARMRPRRRSYPRVLSPSFTCSLRVCWAHEFDQQIMLRLSSVSLFSWTSTGRAGSSSCRSRARRPRKKAVWQPRDTYFIRPPSGSTAYAVRCWTGAPRRSQTGASSLRSALRCWTLGCIFFLFLPRCCMR